MSLNSLRGEIDEIDWRILKLIKNRFNLVPKIKKEKIKLGLKVQDQEREKEIKKRITVFAKKLNLNSDFLEDVFKLIFKESRRFQRK